MYSTRIHTVYIGRSAAPLKPINSRNYQMDTSEIDLVREISWHRARNCFYRTGYALLKELQGIVERATDDLLFIYYSDSSLPQQLPDYRSVTDVLNRLEEDLRRLSERETAAIKWWDELWKPPNSDTMSS